MIYKVLIVDDSKLARMAVNKVWRALSPEWPRLEAASVEEALRLIAESDPDIALLDFNMPGRDGLDLAAELRRSRPRMPVAVISANRQQEILDRTRAAGAAFLGKPLTEHELAGFLSTAVETLSKGQP
jgi:DNA-binding NarL/FixJ family response regulator